MIERLIKLSRAASAISLVLFVLGMAPVLIYLGPDLAMGAQFYEGNTEPIRPELPFPWLSVGLLIVVGLGVELAGFLRERPKLSLVGHAVLGLAAFREIAFMVELFQAAVE